MERRERIRRIIAWEVQPASAIACVVILSALVLITLAVEGAA